MLVACSRVDTFAYSREIKFEFWIPSVEAPDKEGFNGIQRSESVIQVPSELRVERHILGATSIVSYLQNAMAYIQKLNKKKSTLDGFIPKTTYMYRLKLEKIKWTIFSFSLS